jgi:hypothetical protein
VNELTFVQSERSRQVLTEERSLGNNFEKSLINSLLVSSLGFRESSLLLFTFEECLFGLTGLLEVSIVELFINLFYTRMISLQLLNTKYHTTTTILP